MIQSNHKQVVTDAMASLNTHVKVLPLSNTD